MKAMILERFGGTERFAVATVPAPVPKRGEVLVTIKAAGVNPIDVKTRRGGGIADSLRRQRPMILGWDLSGVVSKTGEGVELTLVQLQPIQFQRDEVGVDGFQRLVLFTHNCSFLR